MLNPKSGGNAAADPTDRVGALLAARGIHARFVPLDGPDVVHRVRAAARSASRVIAAGGDGTVNLVAGALAGTTTPLGVLPLGTLNHFAKDLKIPLDLEAAIDTIARDRRAPVDVGEVNGHVFVNNCSIGVYPVIVQVRDALRDQGYGKWHAFYLAATTALRRYPRLRVRLATADAHSVWRTPFVLIGNNEYDVAGLRMTGRSTLQCGRLYAYLAPDIRTRTLPRWLVKEAAARVFARSRTPTGAFRVVPGEEIWIDAQGARRVQIAIDGEVVQTDLPLHAISRPRALQVVVPEAA